MTTQLIKAPKVKVSPIKTPISRPRYAIVLFVFIPSNNKNMEDTIEERAVLASDDYEEMTKEMYDYKNGTSNTRPASGEFIDEVALYDGTKRVAGFRPEFPESN